MENFKPSEADLVKGEQKMTDEQKILSEQREKKIIQTSERVAGLGGQLHDEWRKPRYREESNDYDPRIKKTEDKAWSQAHDGAVEVDIANTPYEDLPSEWQGENKSSAEVAVTEVEQAIESGTPLDDSFIEVASATLHDKWLDRNKRWAPPEQNRPYSELSEEEKEKDRVIIRKAIEVCSKESNNGSGVNNEKTLEQNENLMQCASEVGSAVRLFVNEITDRERVGMNSIIEGRLLNNLHNGGMDCLDLKSVNGSIDMEQLTEALLKVSEGLEGIGQVSSGGVFRENGESLTRLQATIQNIHEAAEKMKGSLQEGNGTAIEGVNRLIEVSHRVLLYVSKRRIALYRYLN